MKIQWKTTLTTRKGQNETRLTTSQTDSLLVFLFKMFSVYINYSEAPCHELFGLADGFASVGCLMG